MKFPKKIYPYLHKLEEIEFNNLRKESYEFRRKNSQELWKEYNHRLKFIEHRLTVFGDDKKIHQINEIN